MSLYFREDQFDRKKHRFEGRKWELIQADSVVRMKIVKLAWCRDEANPKIGLSEWLPSFHSRNTQDAFYNPPDVHTDVAAIQKMVDVFSKEENQVNLFRQRQLPEMIHVKNATMRDGRG